MNRDNDKGKVLIKRSLILGLGEFLLFMVIIARLYYLQVYQADRYKTLADENRISTRLLIPPRGVIYDRNQVILASNRQNFQALIVAEQTTNVQETLDAFKKIMPLSEAEEERIKKELRKTAVLFRLKSKTTSVGKRFQKSSLMHLICRGLSLMKACPAIILSEKSCFMFWGMFLRFRPMMLKMIRCLRYRGSRLANPGLKNFMKKSSAAAAVRSNWKLTPMGGL